MLKFFKIIMLLFLMILPAYSFTDQAGVERVLGKNKAYIEFMNICVTNFAPKEQERFFSIYQMHFNAQVAYLQSDYKDAFRSVYRSQKVHVDLFNSMLTEYYLEEAKQILDTLAPVIIRSKNPTSRLYLTLAYRDRAVSKNLQKAGNAANPRLFSYKITKYLDAIKLSRRSLRFGLLALFESQSTDLKKTIYAHVLEMEREKGNPFYNRFLNKQDREIVDEINRDFDSYEKEYQQIVAQQREVDTQGPESKENIEAGKDVPAKETIGPEKNGKQKKIVYPYEKKVERKVRFRQEKRTADYLKNAEFGKAEDIIRKYVDDFNFKLILAAMEIISARKNETIQNLDFQKLYVHHYDNYARLYHNSVIDTFVSRVKVYDDINENKKQKTDDAQKDVTTSGNNAVEEMKKENSTNVPGQNNSKSNNADQKN